MKVQKKIATREEVWADNYHVPFYQCQIAGCNEKLPIFNMKFNQDIPKEFGGLENIDNILIVCKQHNKLHGSDNIVLSKTNKYDLYRHKNVILKEKCYIPNCKYMITYDNFEIGHNLANAKGGSRQLDNVKPICKHCNLGMGTMNFEEWNEKLGKFHSVDS